MVWATVAQPFPLMYVINVTALTGVYPASGEIVVAKLAGGSIEVVGTLKP